MKKALILGTFFFLAAYLFSHSPSTCLRAGEMYVGLNTPFTGGAEYAALFKMDESGYPLSVFFLPITAQFNVSYGRDLESFEYGITDIFSAGVRVGLIDCIATGIGDNTFEMMASAFGRANIVDKPFLKAHVMSEVWFSPLFSVPQAEWVGAGFINLFTTVDFSFPLFQEKKSSSLFAYADLKHIATFVNMAAIPENLSVAKYIDLPAEELEGISVSYGVMNRLVLALGLDFIWKDLTMNLGWNFRLFDSSLDPKHPYSHSYLKDFEFITNADIGNLELSWQYRIRPSKKAKAAEPAPVEEATKPEAPSAPQSDPAQ
jgi:hypothetical protein